VSELHSLYGSECMDAMARRHDLSSLREDLRSAASLTEMILDSKDVELLLLKNDVQNKLGHLTSDDKKFTSPATASKVSYRLTDICFNIVYCCYLCARLFPLLLFSWWCSGSASAWALSSQLGQLSLPYPSVVGKSSTTLHGWS